MSFCAAILILKVEEKQEHFWHYLPYYFKKDKNATEMQKKNLYGEGVVTYQTKVVWEVPCWRFLTGNLPLHSRGRS